MQSDNSKENESHMFNYDSLNQFKDGCLRSGITSLDLLLTTQWPLDVRNKERVPDVNIV